MSIDYGWDMFIDPPPVDIEKREKRMAVDYVRHVVDMKNLGERGIRERFNTELIRAARSFPAANEAARQFTEMLTRHAETACGVLAEQLKLHARDMVEGTLDPRSMLALIGERLHIGPATDQGQSGLHFWDNYHQAELNGEKLPPLTPAQAAAAKVLHEADQRGEPMQSAAAIFYAMGNLAPTKMSDLFKKGDPRSVLIQKVGRSSYRLTR